MKKLVGLIGSIVVGAAIVTVGLSADLAVYAADSNCQQDGDFQGNNTGCGNVPEPSSVILLGSALAGLGIWSWRRKSRES